MPVTLFIHERQPKFTIFSLHSFFLAAGFVELMCFHPIDTIAKRLMSHTEKYIVPGHIASNLNKVIFKHKADASVPTKLLSLFPGLGFAAGYKISQRVYKFGGKSS